MPARPPEDRDQGRGGKESSAPDALDLHNRTKAAYRRLAAHAERRMGEMLAGTDRAAGGRPSKTSAPREQVSEPPTLDEIGIGRKESAEAQQLGEACLRVRTGRLPALEALPPITPHGAYVAA